MKKSSLWKIHNRFYDLTGFLKKHPGGSHMLLLGKGKDCTELFESTHGLAPIKVKKMLRPYLAKDIPTDPKPSMFEWQDEGFFYEVSRRVSQYFKEAQLSHKASPRFWLWVVPMIICWITLFSLWVATSNIILALITGFLGTSLGFCLFHTASHSALAKKAWINKWVTFLWGDFHGFHYPLWMQHHVIAHHCYTGIHRQDPDIGHAVIAIRKHPNSRWKFVHKLQAITAIPFLTLFPGQWLGQGMQYLQAMFSKKLFGMKIKRYISPKDLYISIPIIFVSLAVHLLLPFSLHGTHFLWSLATYTIAMNVTYWCIVFPNHDTIKSYGKNQPSKDWGIQQVTHSLSFRQPRWLSQLHGGMNYQIEHHLFPSVSPCHYPELSKIVQKCCLDFNIEYPYCNSWFEALCSHLQFLKKLGQKPSHA